MTFAAALLVLTPLVRNQSARSGLWVHHSEKGEVLLEGSALRDINSDNK